MKTYKKKLPDGVRKTFAYDRGVKVRILNSKYFNSQKKNKKENKKDDSDK